MAMGVYIGGGALGSTVITVHETGEPRYLLEGFTPIGRQADPYNASSAVASAGTWATKLDNADGVFSPDGVFDVDPSQIRLYAAVDDRLVFVGSTESVTLDRQTATLRANVRWRDVVEAWLSQPMPTVPASTATEGESEISVFATSDLEMTLEGLGVVVPSGFPTVPIWLPTRATNIRTWLFPAIGALGYAADWTATFDTVTKRLGTPRIELVAEATFRNSTLPVFGDDQLLTEGGPAVQDGRRQVINAWSGSWRYVEEGRGESEEINVYESEGGLHEYRIYRSAMEESRRTWGLRSARWSLPFVRRDQVVSTAGAAVGRRHWPHHRYEVTLAGESAAGLRIGDGLIVDSDLGTSAGRGLSIVGRVISRTVDLTTETSKVLVEARDGRDADYRAWLGAGASRQAAT